MGKGSRIVKGISRFIWENKKDIAIIIVAIIVIAGAGWVIIRIVSSIAQMLGGVMQWISSPFTGGSSTATTTTTTTPAPTTTTTTTTTAPTTTTSPSPSPSPSPTPTQTTPAQPVER